MYQKLDFAVSSTGQLVDKLGELSARIAELNSHANDIKAELIARNTNGECGKRYAVTIVDAFERENFSAKIAKTFLTSAQIAECTSVSVVAPSVRIKAKA